MRNSKGSRGTGELSRVRQTAHKGKQVRSSLVRSWCIVRPSPTRLDNVLHLLLRLVPVVWAELNEVDIVVCRDLAESVKALAVIDEADADTDAAKPAGAADTVQVSLGVGLSVAR